MSQSLLRSCPLTRPPAHPPAHPPTRPRACAPSHLCDKPDEAQRSSGGCGACLAACDARGEQRLRKDERRESEIPVEVLHGDYLVPDNKDDRLQQERGWRVAVQRGSGDGQRTELRQHGEEPRARRARGCVIKVQVQVVEARRKVVAVVRAHEVIKEGLVQEWPAVCCVAGARDGRKGCQRQRAKAQPPRRHEIVHPL